MNEVVSVGTFFLSQVFVFYKTSKKKFFIFLLTFS